MAIGIDKALYRYYGTDENLVIKNGTVSICSDFIKSDKRNKKPPCRNKTAGRFFIWYALLGVFLSLFFFCAAFGFFFLFVIPQTFQSLFSHGNDYQ